MSNDIVVPSSPADQEAIFAVIKEISNSMTRAESEKDYQKEAINELSEKYAIDKKYFRRMAADYHKDQFDQKTAEADSYEQLYESIIK